MDFLRRGEWLTVEHVCSVFTGAGLHRDVQRQRDRDRFVQLREQPTSQTPRCFYVCVRIPKKWKSLSLKPNLKEALSEGLSSVRFLFFQRSRWRIFCFYAWYSLRNLRAVLFLAFVDSWFSATKPQNTHFLLVAHKPIEDRRCRWFSGECHGAVFRSWQLNFRNSIFMALRCWEVNRIHS